MSSRRLIEAAFPLRQVSLDSVHEKNVRHGHISTLHIWPALIATLLPDPGCDAVWATWRSGWTCRCAGTGRAARPAGRGSSPGTAAAPGTWGNPALAHRRQRAMI